MAFSSTLPFATHAANRRLPGIAVTILLHLVLLLGWKMFDVPGPAPLADTRPFIQWISLRVSAPAAAPAAAPAPRQAGPPPDRALLRPALSASVQPRPAAAPAPAVAAPVPAAEPAVTLIAPPAAPAETVMEKARRSAGAVDRALRKENRPYIVAPLDSPEIRMRRGMAEAHAVAAPRLWEAPKIDELVNQTGDGARRDRVTGVLGTYCLSERATNTSIDTIERHGKLRITNCPQHEGTASGQEWRTARD